MSQGAEQISHTADEEDLGATRERRTAENQDFLRRLGLAPTEEEIAAEDAKKAEKREKIIARKAVILKEREEAKEKAEKRPVRLSAKLALIK